MCNLPPDILQEILLQSTPRTLGVVAQISRGFHCKINSRDFVKKYIGKIAPEVLADNQTMYILNRHAYYVILIMITSEDFYVDGKPFYVLELLCKDYRQLNLNKMGINCVLSSIGNLRMLTHLDLSQNRIETLPESVGKLINLEVMALWGNPLRSLPESIGELHKLRILSVHSGCLSDFPSSMSELNELQYLGARSNVFYKIPQVIYQMKQLRKLEISSYAQHSFPDRIGKLVRSPGEPGTYCIDARPPLVIRIVSRPSYLFGCFCAGALLGWLADNNLIPHDLVGCGCIGALLGRLLDHTISRLGA